MTSARDLLPYLPDAPKGASTWPYSKARHTIENLARGILPIIGASDDKFKEIEPVDKWTVAALRYVEGVGPATAKIIMAAVERWKRQTEAEGGV